MAFFTTYNSFVDLGKPLCLQGRKSKLNSRPNSAETTHIFWKRFKYKPRALNVKKSKKKKRCSQACAVKYFVNILLPVTFEAASRSIVPSVNNKQGFALDVIFQNVVVCNFCLKKNVLILFREA